MLLASGFYCFFSIESNLCTFGFNSVICVFLVSVEAYSCASCFSQGIYLCILFQSRNIFVLPVSAEVGGLCGLFLGASLLTLAEFAETVCCVLALVLKGRGQQRTKVQQITISEKSSNVN